MINHTSKAKTLQFFYRNLIHLYRKPSTTHKGYVLFLVISLSIALFGLLTAYALLSKVHSITVKSSANSNSGFYGAEGALNIRAEQLRSIFIDYRKPTGTSPTSLSACTDANSTNKGSGDFICQSQTFVSADSSSEALTAYSYVVDNGNGQPTIGTVPLGENFQNLNMLEYRYSINAVSQKANGSTGQVTAMTEMAIKSRLIPMFQFAAFYLNDLEILPGVLMNLSGPIHTNGNLYLGSDRNSPNGLNIKSQVTLSKKLYNFRKNNNTTYPDGSVRIMNTAGTFLNLLFNGTGSTSPTIEPMDVKKVATAWGSQIKLGIDALSIPDAGILDLNGDYFQKADLRINYTPATNATNIPFELTAISRSSTGSINSTTVLTEGERRSLLQPVLVSQQLATISDTNYKPCTPLIVTSPADLTTENQKAALANAVYIAMISQPNPVAYNGGNPGNTTIGTSLDAVVNSDSNFSSLTNTQKSSLKTSLSTLNRAQLAGLNNRCFVSAPIQDIGRTNYPAFRNDREGRDMRLLQINIESLTIWNKVGRYVNFNNGLVIDNNGGLGFSADQHIFATATANSGAPVGSFQNLDLAGSDSTEGGFVFHATINKTNYPSANGNQSPYGFALVQAKQLPSLAKVGNSDPTGLTFVSDQAVYIQGDYNTQNWQPASILADSLNVLSNKCLNADMAIHKVSAANCNTGNGAAKIAPTPTTINTAFLSGTDITTCNTGTNCYNGGLENYPRFLEGWGGVLLTYRGSFVSTSKPVHVSGTWSSQLYGAPARNWDYDTRFNSAENLPPLAPRFVYLKQESFTRNFNQ